MIHSETIRRAVPLESQPSDEREDEWMNWPTNCRNFRPGLEDPWCIENAASKFGESHSQGAREKVLHIAEFSDYGSKLFDDYVTEEELRGYLELPSERRCQFRLFFPCSLRGWQSATQTFMWRWYSHYSVPMDVAFTFTSRANLGFKHFTELVDGSQIIHLYMTCSIHLEPIMQTQGLRYYTPPARLSHTSNIHRNNMSSPSSVVYRPAVYIQYHRATGKSTILALDYSPIYDMLQRSCEHAPDTGVASDPFAFMVTYLDRLLSSVQSLCETCLDGLHTYETAIFKGMDPATASEWLHLLAGSTRSYHRSHSTLNAIRSNADQILKEHRKFALAEKLPLHISQLVDGSLEDLAARADRLAGELKSYADITSSFTDILLGLSQLQNGLEMRRIAEDNRRQTAAAEAIARDAKWDSEIMKTITVVTLIYLPATFVCTLLSMGIFEWPSSGSEGSVRMTRLWWLFLAIAVPLSIATCGISGAWMLYINRNTAGPPRSPKESDGKTLEVGEDSLSLTALQDGMAKLRARFSAKRHLKGDD